MAEEFDNSPASLPALPDWIDSTAAPDAGTALPSEAKQTSTKGAEYRVIDILEALRVGAKFWGDRGIWIGVENGDFKISITGDFKIGNLETIDEADDIQKAIDRVSAGGGGTVALVPGTYDVSQNISLPSNVTLDGNGSTIDFGGGAFQVNAIGTDAYSTGTVSVSLNGSTVVGVGTTWVAGMVGQYILIGDYWYEITQVNSTTVIIIGTPFVGTTVAGATYVIATTVDNVTIQNITLQNSSTTLFEYRYCYNVTMDILTCMDAPLGISGKDTSVMGLFTSTADTCTAGMDFENVRFVNADNNAALNISGGAGIKFNGTSNIAFGVFSIQNVTGVGLSVANAFNFGIENYAIIGCTSHGVEFVSGNRDIGILDGYIDTCGGDGIKLTATSDRIYLGATPILNCTGSGVNIANANCDTNILVGINTSGNAAGLTDSGTGTLASATVNSFA